MGEYKIAATLENKKAALITMERIIRRALLDLREYDYVKVSDAFFNDVGMTVPVGGQDCHIRFIIEDRVKSKLSLV